MSNHYSHLISDSHLGYLVTEVDAASLEIDGVEPGDGDGGRGDRAVRG